MNLQREELAALLVLLEQCKRDLEFDGDEYLAGYNDGNHQWAHTGGHDPKNGEDFAKVTLSENHSLAIGSLGSYINCLMDLVPSIDATLRSLQNPANTVSSVQPWREERAKEVAEIRVSGNFQAGDHSISFLFVVNELPTNDHASDAGSVIARYINGRWRPPRVTRGYFQQEPGLVYRWADGVVSEAPNYTWSSKDLIPGIADGRIYNADKQCFPSYYRATTLFYCNRFDLFFSTKGDASMYIEDDYRPLTFSHDRGISRLEHAGEWPHLDVREAD